MQEFQLRNIELSEKTIHLMKKTRFSTSTMKKTKEKEKQRVGKNIEKGT